MTWSINWDASNGYGFANTVKPHLATLAVDPANRTVGVARVATRRPRRRGDLSVVFRSGVRVAIPRDRRHPGTPAPRDATSVPLTRRVLDAALASLGVTEDCRADVRLALSEACTNVVRHARLLAELPGDRSASTRRPAPSR